MARWGEGDERWIVSDRPDGTNVNGWHWVRVLIGRFQKQLHTGRARTAPPPLECFSPGVKRRRTGSCSLWWSLTWSLPLLVGFGTPLVPLCFLRRSATASEQSAPLATHDSLDSAWETRPLVGRRSQP
jgi:hypothetical protein